MIKTIIVSLVLGVLCVSSSVCFAEPVVCVDSMEDAVIEAQNTKKKLLVVFGAEWCKFCVLLKKDIDKNPGILDDMVYCYVDIEQRPDLAKEYKVRNMPDLMLLKDSIEIKRTIGYKNIETLKKWIDQ